MNEQIKKIAEQYKDEIKDGFEGYEVIQWWFLTNHLGFSGAFCPDCYDKIRDPQQRVILHLKLEKG